MIHPVILRALMSVGSGQMVYPEKQPITLISIIMARRRGRRLRTYRVRRGGIRM